MQNYKRKISSDYLTALVRQGARLRASDEPLIQTVEHLPARLVPSASGFTCDRILDLPVGRYHNPICRCAWQLSYWCCVWHVGSSKNSAIHAVSGFVRRSSVRDGDFLANRRSFVSVTDGANTKCLPL